MNETDQHQVLFSEEAIAARIGELAADIRKRLGSGELVAVGVLKGAFVFLSDLIRRLDGRISVSFITATSYRDGTVPGELTLHGLDALEVQDRDVLLVEDIVDTGRTLTALLEAVRRLGARSVHSVVLLDKVERREVPVQVDFLGFTVPDEFLVGYGLDHAERYRDLPFVGILKRSAYERET